MKPVDWILSGLIVVVAGVGAFTWWTWPDAAPDPEEVAAAAALPEPGAEAVDEVAADTGDTASVAGTGDTAPDINRAAFADELPEPCEGREPRMMLGQRRDQNGDWVPLTIQVRLDYGMLFAGYRTWGVDATADIEITIRGETSGVDLSRTVTSRAFGSDPEAPCAWTGRVLWLFDEPTLELLQQGSHTYTVTAIDAAEQTASASAEVLFTMNEEPGALPHRVWVQQSAAEGDGDTDAAPAEPTDTDAPAPEAEGPVDPVEVPAEPEPAATPAPPEPEPAGEE